MRRSYEISQNQPKRPGSSSTTVAIERSTADGPGAGIANRSNPSVETTRSRTSVGRRARGASLSDEKTRRSARRSALGRSLARRPDPGGAGACSSRVPPSPLTGAAYREVPARRLLEFAPG
jgi:hypothetical protein